MLSQLFYFLAAAIAVSAASAGAAQPLSDPIRTVDLPSFGNSRLDMVYIDAETAPRAPDADDVLDEIASDGAAAEARDLLRPMNHLYTDLRRGLVRYRQRWSGLPQFEIPSGPAMRAGQEGKRVEMLRRRLGLPAGARFDKDVAAALRAYQETHGLAVDGVADAKTLASLNLGSEHYERIVAINMQRVQALPVGGEHQRYILVDAGAAQLWLYENGRVQDTMRAIVGAPDQQTPKIAALVRYAEVNPYWNVPPDLVQHRIAPRVLGEGLSYLRERGYEVLSDWTDRAHVVDPEGVDWEAVAAGRVEPRVRQLPGNTNAMGEIKFMMPNEYGIYLHDTPGKALFQQANRWISNGCVRVEDARRLARWLFGETPQGRSRDREERVQLQEPVPVYITYMTAAPASGGIHFRADPYDRDAAALARMLDLGGGMEAAPQ